MTESNTHAEDETHRPHPGDQHVAGSRWGEHDSETDTEYDTTEQGTDTDAAGDPIEGHVEPADDEPMVEHVDERPLGEEHTDGVTVPQWSEGAAEPGASPFAGEGVRADEEPAVADEGPIVVGAAGSADDDLRDRTDDDTPADVTEEPVAATDTGGRPTSADDFEIERLIDPADAERFNGEWRDVKAGFVDDPSDALQRASTLSSQVLDELTASLGRLQQNLDGHWNDGDSSDTERLRIALRGYGSLIDRILST